MLALDLGGFPTLLTTLILEHAGRVGSPRFLKEIGSPVAERIAKHIFPDDTDLPLRVEGTDRSDPCLDGGGEGPHPEKKT